MKLNPEALTGYIRNTLGIDGANNETTLFSSGLLDSVSLVNLLMFIEKETGLTIRTEDVTLENFDTQASILRFAAAFV